ncbi:3-hydroxyacyl-CoA dehydrogenase [Xanthobacter oligotrophicus]|uniref:3-hydroxyacyl-CoA dehydrogenase n=1 Tax=Xanthobacter oligotrophicus TaxID=2607286 RepID=UPI0011F1F585|nr:3-hydroxyacyl-CoA dehydrogenase [Xanthobacter oligotrophicus]MCG5238098.1 3-hydroxyacyl-CoA dehydrogenase [Xanthobacter oligotrophicus]
MSEGRDGAIALVGGGSMGVGWAIVFARAGLAVRVHDASAEVRRAVLPAVAERLAELSVHGLLAEAPGEVMARVTVADSLAAALDGAIHVQESVPERLDLKTALFRAMDELAPPHAVLASSTSSLPASEFAGDLPGRARCLVAHPANPPHLLPIVEIVPAPFTAPEAAERTRALMARVGQAPVVLKREVNGFIYNRLQGAVLREAYWMLEQGIADVADIDRVMTSGLGLRWSIVGPFETADLNYRGGLEEHARRMGERYRQMGAERGQPEAWDAALVARAAAERRALLPLDQWEARVAWRDSRLMAACAAGQAQSVPDSAEADDAGTEA